MSKIQVLGLCRWSYPSQTGAFNIEGEGLESIRAALYTPARLEKRLLFLEHIVLPSLGAQRDQDFTFIMLMGEALPDPWRKRVLQLIAPLPQVKAVFRPEGQKHADICREVMIEHRDTSADVVAEFRLDDDDAVACEFVSRLRSYFPTIEPFYKTDAAFALDFNRGFVFRCHDTGEIDFEPVDERLWTPALALYYPPSNPRSLLNYPHMRTWRFMPVLNVNDRPMFVRLAHSGNDSSLLERKINHFRFRMARLPDTMQTRFDIDLPAFDDAWQRQMAGVVDKPS